MNDVFTFFRFTIPGVFFFSLLFISLLITNTEIAFDFLSFVNDYNIASIMIISTSGYLFSMIYRSIFPVHKLDQTNLLNKLIKDDIVFIYNDKNKDSLEQNKMKDELDSRKSDDKIKAYNIINIIWHANISLFDKEKTSFNANILNSQGSIGIASIASIFTYILIIFQFYQKEVCVYQELLVFFILSVFVLFIYFVHNKSVKTYQNWLNTTIYSSLKKAEELNEKNIIFEFYYLE